MCKWEKEKERESCSTWKVCRQKQSLQVRWFTVCFFLLFCHSFPCEIQQRLKPLLCTIMQKIWIKVRKRVEKKTFSYIFFSVKRICWIFFSLRWIEWYRNENNMNCKTEWLPSNEKLLLAHFFSIRIFFLFFLIFFFKLKELFEWEERKERRNFLRKFSVWKA